MTGCFKLRVAAILLVLAACAEADRSETVSTKPPDALVLVTSDSRQGRTYSHGVVVGDGSLVVAFYPAVFDVLSGGRHRLQKRITVASPAWGEVADAEVVVSDAGKQLALLQVPWRGHPALRLADDRSIAAADRMTLVGMPRVIDALAGKNSGPVDAATLFQEVVAAVDYVAMREGKPFWVRLHKEGEAARLWFGAPIVLSDTGDVAALTGARSGGPAPEGGVLNRMVGLADRVRGRAPKTTDATEPPPRDRAREAFLLSVRIAALFGGRQYEATVTECREFISLRPNSLYGYIYAAMAAEQLQQMEEAEQRYREAVDHAPDSLTAQSAYAGFLDRRGQTDRAMAIYESLWQRTTLRPYLSDAICTALARRREDARCCRFLEEALAVDPNHAYALIALGNRQNALKNYAAAAEAFGKAAELWPEHETVRAHFARNLDLAGRAEEAEAQYRKAVVAHPECEYAHHMFASLLARAGPEHNEEARREARTALGLPNDSASDKEKLERLIRDLEAKSGTAGKGD